MINEPTRQGFVHGWAGIRDYFGVLREETVQYWERKYGLPVIRLGSSARPVVIMDIEAAKKWVTSIARADNVPSELQARLGELGVDVEADRHPKADPAWVGRWRLGIRAAAILTCTLVLVGACALARLKSENEEMTGKALFHMALMKYTESERAEREGDLRRSLALINEAIGLFQNYRQKWPHNPAGLWQLGLSKARQSYLLEATADSAASVKVAHEAVLLYKAVIRAKPRSNEPLKKTPDPAALRWQLALSYGAICRLAENSDAIPACAAGVAGLDQLLNGSDFAGFRNYRGDRILYQKGVLHNVLASRLVVSDPVRADRERAAASSALHQAKAIDKTPGLAEKIRVELRKIAEWPGAAGTVPG